MPVSRLSHLHAVVVMGVGLPTTTMTSTIDPAATASPDVVNPRDGGKSAVFLAAIEGALPQRALAVVRHVQ